MRRLLLLAAALAFCLSLAPARDLRADPPDDTGSAPDVSVQEDQPPHNADAKRHFDAGIDAMHHNDWNDAIAEFQSSLQIEPGNPRAQRLLDFVQRKKAEQETAATDAATEAASRRIFLRLSGVQNDDVLPVVRGNVTITVLAHRLRPQLYLVYSLEQKPVQYLPHSNARGEGPDYPFGYRWTWPTSTWRDGIIHIKVSAYTSGRQPLAEIDRTVIVANHLSPAAVELEKEIVADPAASLAKAKQFETDHPMSTEGPFLVEEAAFEAGDRDLGDSALQRLIDIAPEETDGRMFAADWQYSDELPIPSLNLYERVLQTHPKALGFELSTEMAAAQTHDTTEMINVVRLIAVWNPQSAAFANLVLGGQLYREHVSDPISQLNNEPWKEACRLQPIEYPNRQMPWIASLVETVGDLPRR